MCGSSPYLCPMDDLKDRVEEKMRWLMRHREAFAEAFVAEVGCLPSQAVMVVKESVEEGKLTTRLWFELRRDDDKLL